MMIREPHPDITNQYYVLYDLTADVVVVTQKYALFPHRLMLWSFESSLLANG